MPSGANTRQLLRARAAQLDALTRARPELEAERCQGYFAVSHRSADALVELGVIAIRGDVFGGSATQSVLSTRAVIGCGTRTVRTAGLISESAASAKSSAAGAVAALGKVQRGRFSFGGAQGA